MQPKESGARQVKVSEGASNALTTGCLRSGWCSLMAESTTTAVPRKRSPAALIVLVLVAITAVAAVAWYQEQIGYFVRLKGWDRDAPGRAVSQFLTAGLNGERERAGDYLGNDAFKPLEENGKWIGYSLSSMAGTMEFVFAELAPGPDPKATSTEYTYVGSGSATVTVPDKSGKPVRYRLEMIRDRWRITEILGGRLPS